MAGWVKTRGREEGGAWVHMLGMSAVLIVIIFCWVMPSIERSRYYDISLDALLPGAAEGHLYPIQRMYEYTSWESGNTLYTRVYRVGPAYTAKVVVAERDGRAWSYLRAAHFEEIVVWNQLYWSVPVSSRLPWAALFCGG